MSRTTTGTPRPTGLALCWVPKPDAPARSCTLKSGHDGDHHHEYSDTSWPADDAPAACRGRFIG